MAEIRVEKKSGMGWLWALLALLALGLLIWWLAGDAPDETDVAAAPVAAVEPAARATAPAPAPGIGETAGTPAGPITTLQAILASPDPRQLVGQQVRLDGVQVQAVPGDAIFRVGPSADQSVMVRLNENPTPNTPVEGEVNVNPGQTVNLMGTLQSGPIDGANPAGAAGMPTAQDVYIRAQTVTVVERP